MQCDACDFQNPDGMKFCGECGAPLRPAGACTGCGFENPPGFRFCGGCGESLDASAVPRGGAPAREPRNYTPAHLVDKILQSKTSMEGERKRVTVLFADVQGSMELSQQLDPEVWHGILDRFFGILSDGVHRFEGTVNQYTGDGIMALFGAPIAHEDHAQRACYAALQLRDEVARYATEVKRQHGCGFSTRMGLHSGEVVVGKIGDDLRMDYTAQGHTVGLAQRMEALASPDTCYLTAAVAELVGGYFQLEDLGEFNVKGVREPVGVHRLVGLGEARTRFDISKARGLTRFVGRDRDMDTLDDALAQSRAGNGQVVGVVAEAGTGKSRLCFEFAERCRATGMVVNAGTAVAHGKNIPYLPMLQVFRGYFGIDERDDDRTVREKIAGRMLLLDEGFRSVLPVLFEFFGAPDPDQPATRMDPEARQRQLFSVLRRIVQGADPRAGAQSFVTVIEDLHWLDPGSEAFLEQWVDAIAGSSSFLLVNFRPEYRADWMQKSYYRQIPLAPLGPDAIRDLLDDLLGSDASTRGLAEAIHRRTGGNPFFTEEVVQSLIESGQLEGSRGSYRLVTAVEGLEVPASVTALLASRIDRLAEREKQVLQTAAVIGKEFDEGVLSRVMDLPDVDLRGALAALKAAEFVYELSLYPSVQYAFKHPLTQEVALGSQLAERRRRTHAAVAHALEDAPESKLDEAAALLAHHWEEAGEALPAARWHRRAATWVGRSDPAQAVVHLQRALALTDDLPSTPERDALRLAACAALLSGGGWRVGLSKEQAETVFAEGCALAERSGDRDVAIQLHIGYGATLGLAGDIQRYLELARQGVAYVDEGTAPGRIAATYGPGVGYAALCAGRIEESIEHLQLAYELSQGDPDMGVETVGFSVWGQSLQTQAEALCARGSLVEAEERVRRAIQVCRSHDMVEALGWGLGAFVAIVDRMGERAPRALAEEALQRAGECMEVSERSGSPYSLCHAHRALGLAHLLHGHWDAAIPMLEEGLRLAREKSGREREADILSHLSRAYRGAGDVAAARRFAEETLAVASHQGALALMIDGQLASVHADLARGAQADGDAIGRALDAADALVAETGARVFAPQILEARAQLAALRGDAEQARALLERARAGYAAIGATGHAERLAGSPDGVSGP